MTIKYTGAKILIDSPFAKMMQGRSLDPLLGMPPMATDADFVNRPEYSAAAELLGLTSSSQEYVAATIRYLDFIARNSSLADDIDWPSSSYSLWNSNPLADFNAGFVPLYTPSNDFKISIASNGTVPNKQKLQWDFTLSGTSPSFTLSGSDGYSESKTIVSSGFFKLSDTGYNLNFSHTIPGSIPMSASFKYVQSYSSSVLGVAEAIRKARDLCSMLSKDNAKYQQYLFDQAPAEDTIAAFLLCVDKFNG